MPPVEALAEQDLPGLAARIATGILGRGPDAEDAAQEALASLLLQGKRIDQPAAWLVVSTRYECLRLIRRRRRGPSVSLDAEDAPVIGTDPPRDDSPVDALRAALDELPPEDRALLMDHHVLERSQVAIAAALGLSQSTVSKRLEQARDRLRRACLRRGVGLAVLACLLGGSPLAAAESAAAAGSDIPEPSQAGGPGAHSTGHRGPGSGPAATRGPAPWGAVAAGLVVLALGAAAWRWAWSVPAPVAAPVPVSVAVARGPDPGSGGGAAWRPGMVVHLAPEDPDRAEERWFADPRIGPGMAIEAGVRFDHRTCDEALLGPGVVIDPLPGQVLPEGLPLILGAAPDARLVPGRTLPGPDHRYRIELRSRTVGGATVSHIRWLVDGTLSGSWSIPGTIRPGLALRSWGGRGTITLRELQPLVDPDPAAPPPAWSYPGPASTRSRTVGVLPLEALPARSDQPGFSRSYRWRCATPSATAADRIPIRIRSVSDLGTLLAASGMGREPGPWIPDTVFAWVRYRGTGAVVTLHVLAQGRLVHEETRLAWPQAHLFEVAAPWLGHGIQEEVWDTQGD
ncbi:MAG: hypothetical protein RLZZ127_1236 [Planctomycetota bacterium]